jgi:glutamate dehydrogenase
VVHPDGVTIRDGEDPYFVVAADKGTASFSDVANEIAVSRRFWLGDAFASGGSQGYDHKAMGITARGAWISVQRHFLELGVDVQTQPIRVAGVGDMSGDVFGNGMLLSKAIKLVAAFDHRHIFLDPDPDPAASWAERERIFNLPRSSWNDYNKALISPGGGIFPRTQKVIPLSPEIRALLDIDAAEVDPTTLINAILKAPVDLLWFGGIGTYIKAKSKPMRRSAIPATMRSASMLRNCGSRRSARARTWPSRRLAASSSIRLAGASTPTSSTIRPASIARTTRSTSRSRSTARWRKGGWRRRTGTFSSPP